MDMIAHNNDREQDVFQIAPGTGRAVDAAGRSRPTWRTRSGTPRRRVWNRRRDRRGLRARPAQRRRQHDSRHGPAPAACAARCGRRTIPAARSTTPTARSSPTPACPSCCSWRTTTSTGTGYHDTHDTMENIDLDYGAAVRDRHRVGGPGGGEEGKEVTGVTSRQNNREAVQPQGATVPHSTRSPSSRWPGGAEKGEVVTGVTSRQNNREAVQLQSPGSRSAPWVVGPHGHRHREAVQHVVAPLRGANWVRSFDPGCAARPWALELNAFGVGVTTTPRVCLNAFRTLHPSSQSIIPLRT